MAKALAARDAYTEGHAERVGRLAGLMAAEMGWNDGDTQLVELALDQQILSQVPTEAHDRHVDIIITDQRIIYKI